MRGSRIGAQSVGEVQLGQFEPLLPRTVPVRYGSGSVQSSCRLASTRRSARCSMPSTVCTPSTVMRSIGVVIRWVSGSLSAGRKLPEMTGRLAGMSYPVPVRCGWPGRVPPHAGEQAVERAAVGVVERHRPHQHPVRQAGGQMPDRRHHERPHQATPTGVDGGDHTGNPQQSRMTVGRSKSILGSTEAGDRWRH